ncbi:MAG: sigma-70 family RNA polymerase sigma factor, partial [Candidatus Poribacteria bacterium]|nr:sigma-70 family RNA polymerase sigma factor [Candidatus Poribacteria bacterium]
SFPVQLCPMKNDYVQLIQRVLDGDDEAFSALVKKYQRSVHALAWRKVGDFHIAEDITQDAFLKAYQRLSTLKEQQSFASWLYVITANHCKAWLRKKRTWIQSLEETSSAQLERATYSGNIIAENERMTEEAQREVVKKLLAKLQESDRTVITLYYLGGMTYEEISNFLGVSVGAIKSRLHRARQRLKKEEPMIREALGNFQITPNLTENIMQEISRLKPVAPSGGKPLAPWAIGVSTLAVIFLMLGIGNQYMSRFQKPYSFDAPSEMTVELIEAPVVLNLEAKPDIRTQLGSVSTPSEGGTSSQQPNDVSASVAEVESDETVKNHAHWKLPKAAKARFGKGGVTTLQFSPDGTLLAVGSHIGVWLYDVETGEEKSLFTSGMCEALSFSPDGRFLSISSAETLIQLWEIATEREVPLIDLYGDASVLRFSSDGKTLIGLYGSGHAAITRLNIENGKGKTKHLKTGLFGIGLFSSEDFDGVYAMTSDKIAIGKQSGMIQLWDVATRKKLSTLRGHVDLPLQPLNKPVHRMFKNNWVLAVAFSPDGTRLASGSTDMTVRLWNTTGGKDSMTLQKHTGPTNVLAFSPDGKMLASGSTDKTVQLWNTTTGEPLTTLTGHINGITALAFSPDGRTLVSGSTDGTIRFWQTATGDPADTLIAGHTQFIKAATFFPDRRGEVTLKKSAETPKQKPSSKNPLLVSAAFNGEITFWDVETSQRRGEVTSPLRQNSGHRDWYSAVAFSPDGTKLVSAAADGTIVFGGFPIGFSSTKPDNLIRLTDVSTGDELATLQRGSSELIFSPDDRTKTVAITSSGAIRLWNTETGDELVIPIHDDLPLGFHHNVPTVLAVAFSPDGRWLVSGTTEGEIRMWDVATGEPLAVFSELTEPMEREHLRHISALAFSSDRALLAAGTPTQLHLWDVRTGHKLFSVSTVHKRGWRTYHDYPKPLVFSPDGAILVNGHGSGTIQLWDVKTGDRIAALDGHTQQVETLKFSPDAETLVSTAQDGTIFLWDWDEAITESP